jgi:kynurenine formamidase
MATATGLQKLGVEKVKPLVTRGIVLDITGLKGRMLRDGEEITVADLQAALARQGLAETAITPGDAVLIHTGWGSLWMKDNARYGAGQPGIGVEAAKWLAAKQVALVGADNWGVEVGPNPDAALAFPAHQELLTKNGIFLQENLDLAELVADRAWRSFTSLRQCRSRAPRLAGKSDRHPIIPVSPAQQSPPGRCARVSRPRRIKHADVPRRRRGVLARCSRPAVVRRRDRPVQGHRWRHHRRRRRAGPAARDRCARAPADLHRLRPAVGVRPHLGRVAAGAPERRRSSASATLAIGMNDCWRSAMSAATASTSAW